MFGAIDSLTVWRHDSLRRVYYYSLFISITNYNLLYPQIAEAGIVSHNKNDKKDQIQFAQEPLRALTTAETRLKYSTATGEEVVCIAAHQWSWHRRQ